ncbi:MAG TPA: hypothetical protein VGH38_38100 [Bryobacteraceae bacterium]|jgi:hypothetical protein
MAEPGPPTNNAPELPPAPGGARSKDEVALELMKFIAVNTAYGKGVQSAGFSAKSATRTAEEHAESLLELFARCRKAVNQEI